MLSEMDKFKMENLAVFIIVLVSNLLYAIPLMLLWNWLMPEIFGLIKINLWQAFGLLLLMWFLFETEKIKIKR